MLGRQRVGAHVQECSPPLLAFSAPGDEVVGDFLLLFIARTAEFRQKKGAPATGEPPPPESSRDVRTTHVTLEKKGS